MKKLFVLFLAIGSLTLLNAQDDPAKMAKSAGKAYTSYNLDPAGNAAKLEEARTKIDEALKDATVASTSNAWQTKGEIYSSVMFRDMTKKQFDPAYQFTIANPALESYKGFSKAFELAQKKFEKNDALKGLGEVCPQLSNLGVSNYQAGDFPLALESFEACVKTHEMLKANGQKSPFEQPEELNNVKYLCALAAQQNKNTDKATMYFEDLYKAKYNEPAVYEAVFNARIAAGKPEEAKTVIAEGRKTFPDDSGLLFAEINYYLKENKFDELTGRLEAAIAKEPSNVGLYVTLGNIYDNLYQSELKAKNDAKAEENFKKALQYYNAGLEKDGKNVDAIYSLGALYYNKAATLTTELNALPDDTKAETLRKYESLKTQIFAYFDQALPYFKRAESLDPNDRNTLIALKEIFAKKDELELSMEFKKRLEKVEAKGKNDKSYFQN